MEDDGNLNHTPLFMGGQGTSDGDLSAMAVCLHWIVKWALIGLSIAALAWIVTTF